MRFEAHRVDMINSVSLNQLKATQFKTYGITDGKLDVSRDRPANWSVNRAANWPLNIILYRFAKKHAGSQLEKSFCLWKACFLLIST